MDWVIGSLAGLAFGTLALFGERWGEALKARRLRRHTCPTPCLESLRCRCGCGGLHSVDSDQHACGLCGTPVVYDDEEYSGPYNSGHVNVSEITAELPAPKGFTSWGWERDREFRRARHTGRDGHG